MDNDQGGPEWNARNLSSNSVDEILDENGDQYALKIKKGVKFAVLVKPQPEMNSYRIGICFIRGKKRGMIRFDGNFSPTWCVDENTTRALLSILTTLGTLFIERKNDQANFEFCFLAKTTLIRVACHDHFSNPTWMPQLIKYGVPIERLGDFFTLKIKLKPRGSKKRKDQKKRKDAILEETSRL